jgi:hypothetical protein
MIRAEIWVEFCDEIDTVAEIESENIIVDTYEEIQNELAALVEHYEESFEILDSGYEVIDIEVER